MNTQTKYFGQVEYEQSEVITFPNGLFGFDDEREFLLLTFPGGGPESGTLFSLQSVSTPSLAFVAVDPFSLCADYAPVLQKNELAQLGVEQSTDLFFYALCAVKTPPGRSTVNLRCPVAINGDTRKAMQVILEDARYGMRHLLCDVNSREEEVC